MEEKYTLTDLAMMTGLSTRTLRNYMGQDILHGQKENGIWIFSGEELDTFLAHPYIQPSIHAKRNAMIYDFLLDKKKKEEEMCTIADFNVSDEGAEEISNYFCNAINSRKDGSRLRFTFDYANDHARVILTGNAEIVMEILQGYYHP